ncbi:hypothetical protein NDN01_16650 [Sphingomonas sp. QA11]|uniref:phage tail sheath family protein n=1 Tax=Sphingomonas sp. QA11 TaxID=2950605 RepID=UPI00234A2F62|nr:phage tail sheath C-terminal domain-containing protein [Sphingomonas sp. QA11]WCM25661.1 hypothetical protein NDN01_16650 [Sphingomonas sp. QA11]
MATSLKKDRKTPGVYVTEFAAFPPSIVGVATAVPIFVGYTETAKNPSNNKQMYMQAVEISSMADYYSYFGYGFDTKGIVGAGTDTVYDFEAGSSNGETTTVKNYVVGTTEDGTHKISFAAQFNLYSAMQLFYANGGGNCFVVSVGNYWGTQSVTPGGTVTPVDQKTLQSGLAVAADTRGPTMVVVPDACLLVKVKEDGTYDASGYAAVAVDMLNQAGKQQDRVAILDLPGALIPENWNYAGMQEQANALYTSIAPAAANFSYGASYGPALESSLLTSNDVLYTSLTGATDSITTMNNLLTTQLLGLYPPTVDETDNTKTDYSADFVNIAARIAAAFPVAKTDITATPDTVPADITGTTGTTDKLFVSMPDDATYTAPTDAAGIKSLDQYLLNAVPLLGNIQQILADKLNVVPPSGVMAGIWTQNDAQRGVWNAPANFSLNEITAPKVLLTDDQQGGFNAPLNGNAIDVLRAMVNRGTVVWGARTLDGNSLDYRYIQVRRTLNYIEQSIKQALQQFVFAANDGVTWATVTATISNFLTGLWQAGGLMGDKASDAFTVQCGVPQTMSGLDVLNGYMIVNVTVQMIHPAEFIELTFTQTMQGV